MQHFLLWVAASGWPDHFVIRLEVHAVKQSLFQPWVLWLAKSAVGLFRG